MIFVLLPAYNEEESLPRLLPKLADVFDSLGIEYLVLVCSDGSQDRTAELLEKYSQEMAIRILTHKINRGLGETSRDLFELAAELARPDDILVRMDCDDTHEPKYIPTMIEKIREGYDVVVASRFLPGGGQVGVSRYWAFVSYAANLFMRVVFPVKGLREYSCGFRAYRAEIIQEALRVFGDRFIQLRGLGFTATLEKVVKLKMLGARFAEIPFVLRYDQKLSGSKMVGSITTFGYFTMALLYHWPWGGWRSGYRDKLNR
jgi:dolichol-phosphate mannosyltransferase